MEIKSIFGNLLFKLKTDNFKICLETAIKNNANLRNADLRNADLRNADLWNANLRNANLWNADLRNADLRNADLWNANLRNANLRNADLRNADLRNANLRNANLRNVNLRSAYLRYANLRNANLRNADLPYYQNCPPSGSFIAWKKGAFGEIIKLKIPWWARRISPIIGRKCRAEFAIVLSIEHNNKQLSNCSSAHDKNFKYQIGTIIKPDFYDADKRIECSNGIHFFITRKEAENY